MVIALDSVGTKAKSPNAARIGQRNVLIKFTFYNAHLYQRCDPTCSSCYCLGNVACLSRFLPYSSRRVVVAFPRWQNRRHEGSLEGATLRPRRIAVAMC